MRILLEVVLMVLDIYKWVVIATIVISWLIAFGIINTRNQLVDTVWRALNSLTEPVLRPIRRYMPRLNGLDLSPIVLFIIIYVIQQVIARYIYPAMPF
jgi:YggT family protein